MAAIPSMTDRGTLNRGTEDRGLPPAVPQRLALGSMPPLPARSTAPILAMATTLAQNAYLANHIYSTASQAQRKLQIDFEIMGRNWNNGSHIDMTNANYLKDLIVVASNRVKAAVSTKAKGIQFFIIKGGGEGFLDSWLQNVDASRVIAGGATTANSGGQFIFDRNDLLIAFDPQGNFISSAKLIRPIVITTVANSRPKKIWTEYTANRVYNAWDKRPVSIYRNNNYLIEYLGLRVDDSLGYYSSGRARIDIHKEEQTNGCIFIVDPNTPPVSQKVQLDLFEPKFIIDVLASVGKKPADIRSSMHLGIMHMIDIK